MYWQKRFDRVNPNQELEDGKLFFKVALKDGRNFGHTPGNGEGILEGGHQYTYNVGVGKPGLKVTIEKDSVSWDGDDEEVEGTDRE